MTDHISKTHRSWNMKQIKSINTKPEIIVRKILFKNGFRFRLNGHCSKKNHSKKILPGKPDIVLAKYKSVIFVHGCFWHHHKGCKRASWPKSNKNYWIPKIKNNIKRDKSIRNILQSLGWNVLVVWECEINNNEFENRFENFLKK